MAEGESFIFDPRKMIRGPFLTCPFCGAEEFGLLMVTGRGYRRRCRACVKDEGFDLPPVARRVLYLDQVAISQMMKVLHPQHRARFAERPAEESYWLGLFDQIDELIKLQALACPSSHIHWEESFVTADYEALRALYGHLAGDIRLEDSATVKFGQVLRAFDKWSGEEPRELRTRDAVHGNLDSWQDTMRVEARLDPEPEFADDLRFGLGHSLQGMVAQFEAWRDGPRRTFAEYFDEQVKAYGDREIANYIARLKKLADIWAGTAALDEDMVLATNSQIVVQTLLNRLEERGLDIEERFKQLRAFFSSQEIRAMPFLQIACGMFAAMAVKASLQQSRQPNRGLLNDVNVIATYLPYCDAMFVDNECADRLAEAKAELGFDFGTEVFSPRSRDALLEWLRAYRATIADEHRQLVESLYGETWLKPYRGVVEYRLQRSAGD